MGAVMSALMSLQWLTFVVSLAAAFFLVYRIIRHIGDLFYNVMWLGVAANVALLYSVAFLFLPDLVDSTLTAMWSASSRIHALLVIVVVAYWSDKRGRIR
jgi:hypothetical protein